MLSGDDVASASDDVAACAGLAAIVETVGVAEGPGVIVVTAGRLLRPLLLLFIPPAWLGSFLAGGADGVSAGGLTSGGIMDSVLVAAGGMPVGGALFPPPP